jgi:hypothetical protein
MSARTVPVYMDRKYHQRHWGFFRVYKTTPGTNGGKPEMYWGKEYFTFDEALRDLRSEHKGRPWTSAPVCVSDASFEQIKTSSCLSR